MRIAIFSVLAGFAAAQCPEGQVMACSSTSAENCPSSFVTKCVESEPVKHSCQITGLTQYCLQVPGKCLRYTDICKSTMTASQNCTIPTCVAVGPAHSGNASFTLFVTNITSFFDVLNFTNVTLAPAQARPEVWWNAPFSNQPLNVTFGNATHVNYSMSNLTLPNFTISKNLTVSAVTNPSEARARFLRIHNAVVNASVRVRSAVGAFEAFLGADADMNNDSVVDSRDFQLWYVENYHTFSVSQQRDLAFVGSVWSSVDTAAAQVEVAKQVADARMNMLRKSMDALLRQAAAVASVAAKRLADSTDEIGDTLRAWLDEAGDFVDDLADGRTTPKEAQQKLVSGGKALYERAQAWFNRVFSNETSRGRTAAVAAGIIPIQHHIDESSPLPTAVNTGVAMPPPGVPGAFGSQVQDVLSKVNAARGLYIPSMHMGAATMLNSTNVTNTTGLVLENVSLQEIIVRVNGARGLFIPTHGSIAQNASAVVNGTFNESAVQNFISNVNSHRGLFFPPHGSIPAALPNASAMVNGTFSQSAVQDFISNVNSHRGLFIPTHGSIASNASAMVNGTFNESAVQDFISNVNSHRGLFFFPHPNATVNATQALGNSSMVVNASLIDMINAVNRARGIYIPHFTNISNAGNMNTSGFIYNGSMQEMVNAVNSARGIFIPVHPPTPGVVHGLPGPLRLLPPGVVNVDFIRNATTVREAATRALSSLVALFEQFIALVRAERNSVLPLDPTLFQTYRNGSILSAEIASRLSIAAAKYAEFGTVTSVMMELADGKVDNARAASMNFVGFVMPGAPVSPAAISGVAIRPIPAPVDTPLDAALGAALDAAGFAATAAHGKLTSKLDGHVDAATAHFNQTMKSVKQADGHVRDFARIHASKVITAGVTAVAESDLEASFIVDMASGRLDLDVQMCHPIPFGVGIVMCVDIPATPIMSAVNKAKKDPSAIPQVISAALDAAAGMDFRIIHESIRHQGLVSVGSPELARGVFMNSGVLNALAATRLPPSTVSTFTQLLNVVSGPFLRTAPPSGDLPTCLSASTAPPVDVVGGAMGSLLSAFGMHAAARVEGISGPSQTTTSGGTMSIFQNQADIPNVMSALFGMLGRNTAPQASHSTGIEPAVVDVDIVRFDNRTTWSSSVDPWSYDNPNRYTMDGDAFPNMSMPTIDGLAAPETVCDTRQRDILAAALVFMTVLAFVLLITLLAMCAIHRKTQLRLRASKAVGMSGPMFRSPATVGAASVASSRAAAGVVGKPAPSVIDSDTVSACGSKSPNEYI